MRTKVSGFVARLWFASVLVGAFLVSGISLQAAERVLVGMDAEWKYYVNSEPAPSGWNKVDFNDSNWAQGAAPLGYGDPGLGTIILPAAENSPRPITTYFRKKFEIADLAAITHVVGRLVRDDGVVIYLNGEEIARPNMPDVEIMPNTVALTTIGGADETTPIRVEIDAAKLKAGENLLAVELHQAAAASSDARFAFELAGADVIEPRQAVLSITATQAFTSEPIPTALIAPGVFTIRRSEVTDTAFRAWLTYGGTAGHGVDYEETPLVVDFKEGQVEVEVMILGKADDLVEGDETVVAELVLPPTAGPQPYPYRIHPERRHAVVTIRDEDKPTRAKIEITRPEHGEIFEQGAKIVIEAVAVDPAGYFPRVEFFDGEKSIGVSEIQFITAPEPGTPIKHTLEWKDAGLGEHRLTARSANADGTALVSEPVIIHVVRGDPPPTATVTIEATRPQTSEPLPNARIAPGLFTLKRSGNIESAFKVRVGYGGTATRGADYTELPNEVEFKAGQLEALLEVFALSDELVEGDETVVAELPYQVTTDVPRYNINPEKRRAVVTINDEDRPEPGPTIEITQPKNGDEFREGTTIVINAIAIDPKGYISRVEFFDGETSIGVSEIVFVQAPAPGTPIEHTLEWKGAIVGAHHLTARSGSDANGARVISEPVVIHVLPSGPRPPLVSIHTINDPRDIAWPDADYAADWFEIRRTGEGAEALTVFFDVAEVSVPEKPLATPGVDYKELKETVVIPVGVASVVIKVEAIDDRLVEGPEYVHLILKPVPPNVDPIGGGAYQIDEEHASASVVIQDNDQNVPEVVRLAVEVKDPKASEFSITASIDSALFHIKRVGGPKVAVMAQYTLGGTASNGVDYEELTGVVEIPADADFAAVRINPIYDKAIEGEETVILTLVPPACPAIHPPPPECYEIGEPGSGRAVIVDGPGEEFAVRIASPRNGAVFNLGQVIEIEANASGDVAKLEISHDGVSLGSTTDNHLTVRWTDATVGGHAIRAEAVSSSGKETKAEIKILVRERDASAFVFRKLPDAYTPGTAFGVELRAEPPEGAHAYAVEDHPPTGWAVSGISHGGAYDEATGKVKFGPFTDTEDRTLTYRVRPPANASGPKEFSGTGSVDGVNYPIGGDRIVRQGATHHPADTDSNFVMVVNEVTAYAAAWKQGGDEIPLSYVTRAGYLWKSGETYKFEGTKAPPLCWVPVNGGDGESVAAASAAQSERAGDGETRPGVGSTMTIRIVPPAGTKAYNLEEKLPVGWNVSNISHEGTFDARTGTIRWGVFYDATARTFSYQLTAPPGIAVVARFSGKVSFDGVVREVTGRERLVSSDNATRPELRHCERDASGKVRLQLTGAAGQVGVLQSSSDLEIWSDIATVYLPDGTVEFEDDAGANIHRYYRLQVR